MNLRKSAVFYENLGFGHGLSPQVGPFKRALGSSLHVSGDFRAS